MGSYPSPQILVNKSYANTITVEPIKAKRYVWVADNTEIKEYIEEVFTPLGDEAVAWAVRVAQCESNFDPMAESPNGLWYGIFQYALPTYYGNGGTNWTDWKEMVRVTYQIISKEGLDNAKWRWPACSAQFDNTYREW